MTGEVVAHYAGYVGSAFAIIVPIFLIIILSFRLEKLKSRKFRDIWGAFYDGMKLDNKMQASFYLFFLIRRMVFLFAVFYFTFEGAIFQIMIVIFLNYMMVIYQGSYYPKILRFDNKMEFFYETMIGNISFTFFFFTDWIGKSDV